MPVPVRGFRSILQKHRDLTEQPGMKPGIRDGETATGHCREKSTQPPRPARCPAVPRLTTPAAAQDAGCEPWRHCRLLGARPISLGFLVVLLGLSIIHDAPPLPAMLSEQEANRVSSLVPLCYGIRERDCRRDQTSALMAAEAIKPVLNPLRISPSARTAGTATALCKALEISSRGEPCESRRRGLKVDVDFTLPFGWRRWRWVAVSRGEAEGATFISSCTHVRFHSALRFYRKQQEVGSGGEPKRKNRRVLAGKHVKEEEKSRYHHHSPETLLLLRRGLKI